MKLLCLMLLIPCIQTDAKSILEEKFQNISKEVASPNRGRRWYNSPFNYDKEHSGAMPLLLEPNHARPALNRGGEHKSDSFDVNLRDASEGYYVSDFSKWWYNVLNLKPSSENKENRIKDTLLFIITVLLLPIF